MIYEGGFREDVYDGDGTEYNPDGAKVYEGRFQLGEYSGSGVRYDPATGKVFEEGEFRNGILLTPKKELDEAREPSTESPESAEGATSEDGQETQAQETIAQETKPQEPEIPVAVPGAG